MKFSKESKSKLKKLALEINKTNELIDFCSDYNTKRNIIDISKNLKNILGTEEWSALKLRGKLNAEWLKALPDVKVD